MVPRDSVPRGCRGSNQPPFFFFSDPGRGFSRLCWRWGKVPLAKPNRNSAARSAGWETRVGFGSEWENHEEELKRLRDERVPSPSPSPFPPPSPPEGGQGKAKGQRTSRVAAPQGAGQPLHRARTETAWGE